MGKQARIPDELTVLLSGRRAGMLRQDGYGRLSFEYDSGWKDEAGGYSLSLSMPMARRTHDDTVVRPFLEGLLPDDDERLKQLGRTHQVSAGNPFALLTHLGEDCAGAVQFVREDRLDEVLRRPAGAEVVWRDEDEIGRDLRELVAVRAGERSVSRSYGYFSLAGAQPKLALLHKDGRWGVPHGRTPTTHILKPPAIKDVDGFAVNEHFCLQLARAAGIDAAESEVRTFGGETAIVVTRYDRAWQGEWPVRVHQEDVCQALSVPPRTKYEHEGGPGALAILRLLEDQSDDPARDVARFLDALALNWVIGGTDAHAKNYSLLLRAENRVALAPFYDLASMLAYPSLLAYRKVKLAMRIGREHGLWKIDARHWARMAEEAGLDRDPVIERVAWVTAQIRDAVPPSRSRSGTRGSITTWYVAWRPGCSATRSGASRSSRPDDKAVWWTRRHPRVCRASPVRLRDGPIPHPATPARRRRSSMQRKHRRRRKMRRPWATASTVPYAGGGVRVWTTAGGPARGP